MLIIAEKLLLLALHDEKGTILSSASASLLYGLSGAVLMELTLNKRLHIDKKNLLVSDSTPTGNDILDEALLKIKQAKKERDAEYWVTSLSTGIKKLKERLLDQLVQAGILRKEERRILRIFPVTRYPLQRSEVEEEIRGQVRAVLLNEQAPDSQTAMLISLAVACDLIGELFSREERKQATKRAEQIAEKSLINETVSDAVSAVDTAVAAGVQIAIIAAVATSVAVNCSASCSPSCSSSCSSSY